LIRSVDLINGSCVPKQPKTDTPQSKKEKSLYRPKSNVAAVCDRRKNESASEDFSHAVTLAPSHFELREDGTINSGTGVSPVRSSHLPQLVYSSSAPFIRLYQGNCFDLLDAIAAGGASVLASRLQFPQRPRRDIVVDSTR